MILVVRLAQKHPLQLVLLLKLKRLAVMVTKKPSSILSPVTKSVRLGLAVFLAKVTLQPNPARPTLIVASTNHAVSYSATVDGCFVVAKKS
jgi:hypothetical protein